MTAARRLSPQPPVHRLTVPAGPVDGTGALRKMQGKIKGRGTRPLENPVCTWGWRGTRRGAGACRDSAQCRGGIGEDACFVRPAALLLDGDTA